jgi:hypothetical protein
MAVGRLGIAGPWVGFVGTEDGYCVAFGQTDGSLMTSAAGGPERVVELLAVAIVYYEEALDAGPSQVEATQADLAGLLTWLTATEGKPAPRASLAEALDAIDDGLAGDAVLGRLNAARRAITGDESREQAGAVDLLRARFDDLRRNAAAQVVQSG